ncbi:MAG: type II secretion system protein [Campylobacterota bacterium]|nr:type II secretion system protein [Campylobacterota bacterium]
MMLQKQREAFSMITAIFLIVIMASITGLVMSTAGKIVQETTSQYQKEQAVLWAKSYTEYAVMSVMSNDRNGTGNCIETITGDIDDPENGQGYRIDTRISFIGNVEQVNSCTNVLSNAVVTTQSPLNILVDVYVSYRDFNDPDVSTAPWIVYHRRSLQKI